MKSTITIKMKRTLLGLAVFVGSLGVVSPAFAQCPPPNATTATVNCGSSAVLTASGSTGIFRWYSVPTGGTILGTGATFITPNLFNATNTFYVEAVNSLTNPSCISGRVAVLVGTTSIAGPSTAGTSISCGSTATVTASGASGIYRWYNDQTGGTHVAQAASYTYSPIGTDTVWAEALSANPSGSATFNFSGGVQTWTVPAGVTAITVDMRGGQGGQGYNTQVGYSDGGNGGRVVATLPVTAGQTLSLYVGGAGAHGNSGTGTFAGGYNGGGIGYYRAGGGGGSTDIRVGGTALSNRVMVAGGGGGGSWNCNTFNHQKGGDGGGLTGGIGLYCNTNNNTYYNGFGGTQTAGGNNAGYYGGAAGLFQGSGFTYGIYSGGGGGGHYGGGAGYLAGGGGGSSWTGPNATNITHTQGFQTGNGQILITYNIEHCKSTRVPAIVSVAPIQAPTVTSPVQAFCGSPLTVNASGSTSGLYSWYGDSAATNLISDSTALFFPYLLNSDTVYVGTNSPKTSGGTQSFNFTGAVQSFTVPANVTELNVDLRGAAGGASEASINQGGLGGRVQAKLAVTPGTVLNIYIGGVGTQGGASWTWYNGGWNGGGNGWRGGGGGGASDIRIGGTALTNRVLVAGGGGGAGRTGSNTNWDRGGAGGGTSGGAGFYQNANTNLCYIGTGGSATGAGQTAPNCWGGSASSGIGANAAGSSCNFGAGGGGGGFWGGGGGYCGGAGGGGSSFANATSTTDVIHSQGFQNGNGALTLSWSFPIPFCSSNLVPVVINVNAPAFVSLLDDTITCGNPAQLTAIPNTGFVNWYNVPTGGTPLFQGVGVALPNQFASSTYYAEVVSPYQVGGTFTFNFTGAVQTWTVPANVFSIDVNMAGAEGGTSGVGSNNGGGFGGRVTATMAVTPGEVLNIYVGGTTTTTTGGWNGGGNANANYSQYGRGGGGGTDIRIGGTTFNDRVIVAGGGGGGGYNCSSNNRGGHGGDLIAENGWQCNNNNFNSCVVGEGGTQTAGGLNGSCCSQSDGNGQLGIGGNSASACWDYGGGGGGGYYGGGGGYYGGGGGGSSWTNAQRCTNVTHVQGDRQGAGIVTISYLMNLSCTSPRLPVSIVLDSLPAPTITPDAFGCAPVTNTFQASGGFGTFSWTDVPSGQGTNLGTGSTYTGTANDTTTYYVGYTDVNGCPSKRAAGTIFATPLPNASISAAGSNVVCDNFGIVTLQPATAGGLFSGSGIVNTVTGDFDASTAPLGINTVTYTVVANGCQNSSTTDITVLAGPDASIASTPSGYCLYDNPAQLTAIDPTGVWSGSGVSPMGMFDPASVSSGTYTLYHSVTASNGCIDMDSIQVVVNPTPNASIVGSPSVLCTTGSPVAFNAATQGGTWSGTSAINANSGVFNPQSANIGSVMVGYSVVQNGCLDQDSVMVQIIAGPNPTILNAPSLVCQNASSVLLSAAETGGVWSGAGIANPNSGLFNPALTQPGAVTVYHSKTQGQCSAIDSVTFQIGITPSVALSPSGIQSVCEGNSINLVGSAGAASIQWFVGGSPIPGANASTYSANQQGTYSYQATSADNCSASSSPVSVVVNPKPVITGIQANTVCEGTSTFFTQSSNVASANGASVDVYAWDFGTGSGANTSQVSFTYPAAGTYTAQLIVITNHGCSDTLTQSVVVNPAPVVTGLAASDVCNGTAVNFSGASSIAPINNASIQSQTWNFGNGISGFGSSTSHLYGQTGVYNYTYTVVSNHGCSTMANGTVNVFANPTALFTANNDCEGSSVIFNNLSSANAVTFDWNFGDGNTSTIQTPTHVYASSGQYNPTLLVTTANGCTATYGVSLSIAPSPSSSFTNTPAGGLSYQFTPGTINASSAYGWSFGDGTASTAVAPLKTYLFSGQYNVCLTVSRNNCSTTTCNVVNITNQMGINDGTTTDLGVYPNPFQQTFTLSIALPETRNVSVAMFDLSGKLVFRRNEGQLSTGTHSLSIDTNPYDLANGMYVVEITMGDEVHHVRVVRSN